MKQIFKTFLLVSTLLFINLVQVQSQVLEPVKWKFSSKQLSNNEAELIFKADIENKWHLYSQYIDEGGPIPTAFIFDKSSDYELIGKITETPEPEEIYDSAFEMNLKLFSKNATFKQKIKLLSDNPFIIKGYLEFMCCDDERCLPPAFVDFEFKIKPAKVEVSVLDTTEIAENVFPITDTTFKDTGEIISNSSELVESTEASPDVDFETKSLWLFFFISLLAGLAAILTPCVFPMIPMTVSFFMKNSKNKARAKTQALFYGFSIIVIYTFIGTVVAMTLGPNFANLLSTHWLPNFLFFLLFIVFAASFLGMFEIILPSWLVNKTDKQADKGGFTGTFFMALTLVLVSFACTGPIVGAILVESAGGQVLKPIIGMFGFSLAFALPFTFLALFPSLLSSLPKSGGWLNSVKVVLGFIILAFGMKFLIIPDQAYHWGILTREIYLAFWIVIFTLMGFYLLGKIKFAHDSSLPFISVPRLILAIITFAFVVYLIPGMFGAPLKAISGLIPPQTSAHPPDTLRYGAGLTPSQRDGEILKAITSENSSLICEKPVYSDFLHLPHGLQGYYDYEQGLECAKKLNKPIFLDFVGHGCSKCREMEAKVWSAPGVLKRLRENYLIIALYVDDKTKLPESQWVTSSYDGKVKKTIGKKYADFQITKFNINAQPYYVLLDNNGKLLTQPKSYDLNVNNFIEFLDKGMEEFVRR